MTYCKLIVATLLHACALEGVGQTTPFYTGATSNKVITIPESLPSEKEISLKEAREKDEMDADKADSIVTLNMEALISMEKKLNETIEAHKRYTDSIANAAEVQTQRQLIASQKLRITNYINRVDTLEKLIHERSTEVDALRAEKDKADSLRMAAAVKEAEEQRLRKDREAKRAEESRQSNLSIKEIQEECDTRRDSAMLHFRALITQQARSGPPEKRKGLVRDLTRQRNDSIREIDQDEDLLIESWYSARGSTGWLRVMGSEYDTRQFFDPFDSDNSKFLQSNILSLSTDYPKGSLYSELYHDYFGVVRVGLGGMLSNDVDGQDSTAAPTDSTTADMDLAQRIQGGGGNIVLSLQLPLVGCTSRRGTLYFRGTLQPKMALDLQNIEQEAGKIPCYADIGAETHLSYTGSDGVLGGFLSVRPSVLVGNPILFDALNKENWKAAPMIQIRLGVSVVNLLRLSYLFVVGDPFVQRTFSPQISIQLLTSGLSPGK